MYVTFDIGGSNTRFAFSPDGKTLEEPVKIPTNQNFAEAMREIAALVSQCTHGRPIRAAAGGVPGALDPEHSMIARALNIPEWVGKPLKAELERMLHAPVTIENDTTMYGLAEVNQGDVKQKNIVVYLTISTGVGGKRFVRGKVDESAFGFEPGYQIIDLPVASSRSDPDLQKKTGYLEMLIGGKSLRSRFGKKAEDVDDPAIWDEAAFYLAAGLNNVTVFWSPELIILGGPVGSDIPLDTVKKYLRELNPIFPALPEIRHAQLGDSGGLQGALMVLTNTQENPR